VTVGYGKLLKQGKVLFQAVAKLPSSLHVSAIMLKLTRLARDGGITEGTSQDIVRDAADVFGGEKKRRKIGHPSTGNAASVSPLVGRAAGPGHPQQQRIRGPTESPAPLEKKRPSCVFCGSNMGTDRHCRVNQCPRVKAIGIFLKGNAQNEFAEKLLNGTFPSDDVSRVDGSRLRANIRTSLPVSAKFICVHRHFTVSQGFAPELLYQASNRAAEVTMYEEGGSILEDYDRVADSVTAVSIWTNRNKNDNVISAMRDSH
jgi:hypothetical protein